MHADVSTRGVRQALWMRMGLLLLVLSVVALVVSRLTPQHAMVVAMSWSGVVAALYVTAVVVALIVGYVFTRQATSYAARARDALDRVRDGYTSSHHHYVLALEDTLDAASDLLRQHDQGAAETDVDWERLRDELCGVNEHAQYPVYTGEDRAEADTEPLAATTPASSN